MDKKWTINVVVLAVMFCCCAFAQEELHSWVANALGKIKPKLEKAVNMVNQGDMANAKVYLESAQKEWDQMHKSLRDKFSDDHSEIVAVRKQLSAARAKVLGATAVKEAKPEAAAPKVEKSKKIDGRVAPKVEAPKTTAGANGPAITDPLPSTMLYEMKNFNKAMDRTLDEAPTMNIEYARQYLEKESDWILKKKWNKGKFHPQHPDVLALDAKVEAARSAVAARVAKADDAEGNLAGVLGVIQKNAEALKLAHDDAKWKVRSISSTISDGEVKKLSAEMEKARISIERVNALLPAARAAVMAFRKQYPDMKEMMKLVKNGLEARNAVQQVERFPNNWLDEVGREVTAALDEAEENIKMYGLEDLAGKEGLDEALTRNWADSAEELVVICSSTLLETIDLLLPELPEADRTVLPEFVQARQKALDRAAPMRTQIAKVEVAAHKIRQDMVDAKHRKLAAARFPKSEFHGGQWDDAEQVIRKAFETKIRDKDLLKLDIYLPWEVREEAKWRNDQWEVKTYRYIGANCLTKLSSGKYMVYRMNFRNTKLADGSWSTLEQWSVGHVYEMLEENINE